MKGGRLFKISFTFLIICVLMTQFLVKQKSQSHYFQTRLNTFTRYIEDDIHELVSIIQSKKQMMNSFDQIYSPLRDGGSSDFNLTLSILIQNNDHISSIKLFSDDNEVTTFYKKNGKVYLTVDDVDFLKTKTEQISSFSAKHQTMVKNGESPLVWDKPHINSYDKFLNFSAYFFHEHYYMIVKSDISAINSAYLFNNQNDYYRFLVDSLGNPVSKHKMGFNNGMNKSLIPIKIAPTDTFALDGGLDKPTFDNQYKTIERKEGKYAVKLVRLNKSNLDSLFLLFMVPYDHLIMKANYAMYLYVLEWVLPLLLLVLTVLYFITHKVTRNKKFVLAINSRLGKLFSNSASTGTEEKINNGKLSEDEFGNIRQKVHGMISDKLFLQSQLSIEQCASELQIDKQLLSQYIQLTYNTSYRMFINDLRVKEALKIMQRDPKFVEKYSFEHLGEMVGFNSRTSFYRAFKHHSGCSPTEYFNTETESI